MVQYTLWIKATLENVESLKWADGEEDEKEEESSSEDTGAAPQRRTAATQQRSSCTLLCCSIRNPTDPEDVREKIVVDFSELEKPSGDHSPHAPPHSTTTTTTTTMSHHKQKHHHHHHKHHEKPYHFHVTWSDHSKGTIRVVQVNHYTDPENNYFPYALESDEWYPVLTCECENVEPVQFHPLGNEFVVRNRHGGTVDIGMADVVVSSNEDGSSSGGWRAHEWSTGTTALLNFQSKFE